MKIGIIGTGAIGEVIIRNLRTADYEVKMANANGPESLKELALEVGATAVTVENAVQDVDIAILALPTKAIPELPKDLFAKVKPGTIVIDTSNYYPSFRDGKIDELEKGMPESEWVSWQIRYPVIKAFNAMIAHSLTYKGRPSGSTDRLALPVSGDDSQAKNAVAKIIDSIGFDAVDIGSISESWKQQPGSSIYCADLTKEEILHWYPKTQKALLPERREQISQVYLNLPEGATIKDQLKALRDILQNNLA
ncbi:MAG: NAD(P)-binding domain-containing protein [Flavobacterium sp.]|uniref:NADPH-dependent F420 reductase n=1 Tax=Flavobacterium sp. TaxID=239 RepID=UPI002FC65F3A